MSSTEAWLMSTRDLKAGQQSQVWIADLDGTTRLVHCDNTLLLEAPNWASDGQNLLLNGDGRLWRLALDGDRTLADVAITGLPPINNDHVLHPDGEHIFLSANDGQLYRAPLAGGRAERITRDDTRCHFLHGISPDGNTLAFVDLPADLVGAGRLATMSAGGGPVTHYDTGPTHLDGPEYSPDGQTLCVNTEQFARRPGHAQLAWMPAAGGRMQQLVASDTVDWFPHLSPDGMFATYVSFPPGTLGHPADLPVTVVVVRTDDWQHPVALIPLPGGQGTINVNSWSPDSNHFALVSYPTIP